LKTLIIAEAGVNHNGDLNLAYKLAKTAKEIGADVIKFQIFITEKLVSKKAPKAYYQKETTKTSESQFDMLKELQLSFEEFKKIKNYCDNIGIMFLASPFDKESLDFLIDELKVFAIKIGSGEIINLPFLEEAASKNKPLIISTGMSTLGDIEKAVNVIAPYIGTVKGGILPPLTLLHCTTNYPCPMEEVNLNAMVTLRDAFKFPVGYSDHTLGIEVPIAAIALGAIIVEKHFTLSKSLPGPDHKASLEPKEFKLMVESIRNIEKALGDGIKRPNKSEMEIMKVARKVLVAARDISKGEIIKDQDIVIKRAGIGISPEFKNIILGMKIYKDIMKDDPFDWEIFKEGQYE
jgi:N-acetylneuraminate synthase